GLDVTKARHGNKIKLRVQLAGARAVELVSAVYFQGYEVLAQIRDELNAWMEAKGYSTLDDFRGKVCSRIVSLADVDRGRKCVADVDPQAKGGGEEKCVRCGLCRRICIYDAVGGDDEHFVIMAEQCVGCGMCEQICPVGAIHMLPISE
ncbi:MAG: 4Fe-4S binding protein, partial [Planctomycetia bacterium]|nr:4Fe-4S binding protein [Planctomycetia bacterium]